MRKFLCLLCAFCLLLTVAVGAQSGGYTAQLCGQQSGNVSIAKTDIIAVQVNLTAPALSLGAVSAAGTYSAALFAFNENYDKSLQAEAIATKTYQRCAEETVLALDFSTPLPAGEYLYVLYDCSGSGVHGCEASESQRMYKNGVYQDSKTVSFTVTYESKPESDYKKPSLPTYSKVDATPLKSAVFTFDDDIKIASGANATSVEQGDGCLVINSEKNGDPYMCFDLASYEISTSLYPVILIRMKLPDVKAWQRSGQLFFTTSDVTGFAEAASASLSYERTTDWQNLIIDLSSNSYCGGTLSVLRWDVFRTGEEACSVKVDYLCFFSSYEAAAAFDGNFSAADETTAAPDTSVPETDASADTAPSSGTEQLTGGDTEGKTEEVPSGEVVSINFTLVYVLFAVDAVLIAAAIVILYKKKGSRK